LGQAEAVAHVRWQRDEFEIDTDPARVDVGVVHGYLERSYWAAGIPRETVERSLLHSLCFGLYVGAEQIGFARVVSDRTTFAWIGDVFVLEEWRGRGLGVWLMQTITAHPELQSLRRWMLATRDAHGLYAKVGFLPLDDPASYMLRR
jgi:GNAT superfamily N-acetyltransferase